MFHMISFPSVAHPTSGRRKHTVSVEPLNIKEGRELHEAASHVNRLPKEGTS